jgi:hypothetical protein
MALSLREIYRKLRKALEDVLSRDALPIVSDRFQPIFTEVGKMCLREEDIVSIEDFAVMVAFRLNVMNGGMRIPHYDPELQLFVCENLLRLLRPVENGLLPPQGPTTLRIWEVFANANAQQRQFCILAVFVLCLGAPLPVILLKSNPMVVEIQRKFDGLLASFQQVRVLLEKQALLTPELQRLMKDFESRLSSCCQGMIPRILRKDRAACPDQQEFSELTMRWARLSAQASEIAVEVAKLPSIEASIADTIEVTSLDSWSIVSERNVGLKAAEVASVASQRSVDSQTSCLSGHGGPHCFLPSHLFKQYQSADALPVALVSAQDGGFQTDIFLMSHSIVPCLAFVDVMLQYEVSLIMFIKQHSLRRSSLQEFNCTGTD